MSQNIRAVPGLSPRHGSTWNVAGVRLGQHVGLVDPGEALDGRAVEADALGERALELGGRDGHGLEGPEHIGEPQPHEADVALLDGAEDELLLTIHVSNPALVLFRPGYASTRVTRGERPGPRCDRVCR